MPQRYTRDELVARLVRTGELMVSGDRPEEVESAFDPKTFAFHGPDGFDTDYAGLMDYFRALREAFDDRSIRRGIMVVEGDLLACQTWIEGTFVRPFTHSPVGPLEPTGNRVVMDLINIFRFDDEGRLIEEFVRTDNRSTLAQLGAEGA
jgi:predicted ester cyclase